MGVFCSDAKKCPRCIPTITHFESSFGEVSDCIYSVSVNSVQNQIRRFGGEKSTPQARLDYYNRKIKIKTRYVDTKMVTSTDRGRARQTITISERKITRRSASEHFSFHTRGDSVGRTSDFSDHEAKPNVEQNSEPILLGRARRTEDKSVGDLSCDLRKLVNYDSGKFDFGIQDHGTISTGKTSSGDISLFSDRIPKSTSWDMRKSEASVISRSSKSSFQGIEAKTFNSDKSDLILNLADCTLRAEKAASINISELSSKGESKSLPLCGEPRAKKAGDEHDNILSDYTSCPFIALQDDEHQQKERSPITDDITYESEQTSLKTSQRNFKFSIEIAKIGRFEI